MNPFNEYECGHWYARALSSDALMQGLTGLKKGEAFIEVVSGNIQIDKYVDVYVYASII